MAHHEDHNEEASDPPTPPEASTPPPTRPQQNGNLQQNGEVTCVKHASDKMGGNGYMGYTPCAGVESLLYSPRRVDRGCNGFIMESSCTGSIDTTTTALSDGSLIDYKLMGGSQSTITTDGKFDVEAATTSEGVVRLDNHGRPYPGWLAITTLLVLLFANLLNYIDRCTIAGVLMEIQEYFDIDNSDAGLLQTSFIVSYMVLSPVFGYLGDRCNRKIIMAIGIFSWSLVTLAGSFVPQNCFWLFMLLRAAVGIGEASYSTIAPTIIADLFTHNQRTLALAIFYFAIPVGSGMGYIVGANVASALGSWRYALRVTPGLGILCVLAIIFIVREPARGASEGGTHIGSTSWCADLAYLAKNRSFIFSTLGFTCVAFVAGALSLWAPSYLQYSIRVQGKYQSESEVSLLFGIITCLAGFFGVGIGTFAAGQIRRYNPRADPLVCAFGLISAAPFLFLTLYVAKFNTTATWIFVFLAETLVCLNWAIVTDIVLYIVIPTRRSTAEAIQILVSHALGDASSPYLIGAISDRIRPMQAWRGEAASQFLSLQSALYMTTFVCVIGGGFFLATALFIRKDRMRAEKLTHGLRVTDSSTEASGRMLDGDTSTASPEEANGAARVLA